MRISAAKKSRRLPRSTLSARLNRHAALQADATTGQVVAVFHGHVVSLGAFSGNLAGRLQRLHDGLPLNSFAARGRKVDNEINRLVRRLAKRGLLEYYLRRSQDHKDQIVIEPQISDYWPATPRLGNADVLVLSRFAYMRRRGKDLVLESPRAGALFRICDPKIAFAIAALSAPQSVKRLRRQPGFAGIELPALLVDCQILLKIEPGDKSVLRQGEGDHNLVCWDFHDLLFHARSTQGRHANPFGAVYPHLGTASPLPAVRPRWPGKTIDLRNSTADQSDANSPFVRLLHQRHSTRNFDANSPITINELALFLENTARVRSQWTSSSTEGGPSVNYTVRPYPSAGASYELELYLAVDTCNGLARGFYHYDAEGHALAPIDARASELEALFVAAQLAMGVSARPQILITMAARFGRMSWKYSALAYALILKDAGVLTQTFYLMATEMGLGGCAIGPANIDLFAKITGIAFHIEGPVGQFALGRGPNFSVPSGSR